MDGEPKIALAKLTDKIEAERTENAKFREEVRAVLVALTDGQSETRADLRVVSARLDEQRQTINAMIPTRLAAVPASSDERCPS
jgi:hypothetical protein